MNIIALSPNAWDGQWVNRQQLLSRIGISHTVLYSSGAFATWERGSDDWRASPFVGAFVRKDNIQLDQPPRWLLRWPRVGVIDRLAVAAAARRWRRQLDTSRPLVAWLCHPMFVPYLDALSPDFVVYHCYDLYERQPGWSSQLEAYERRLLREADLVFSPTTMLCDELMKKAPCDARALPNGADVQAVFAARKAALDEPADLSDIPHPRVGYVGSLHPELDLALIAELARRRPAWHFVLIGPEQNPARLHASAGYKMCRALANVHLLGEKHRSQVPGYLLGMDANALIYRATADSWTHLAYPLKLHEYLASGQPVISVDLKMIREFEPLVRFATGVDEWERALEHALAGEDGGQAEQRRAIAARHGWAARVGTLQGWLDELPALRRTRQERQT